MWCGNPIPDTESARTFATPPNRVFVANGQVVSLPEGCGWVICGEHCPELPPNAVVFYRKIGWEVNPNSTKRKKKVKTL